MVADPTGRADSGDEEDDEPLVAIAAGAVTFLTLGVAFGLMFLGNPFFWVAFPVGFGGLLPLAVAVARYYESRDERGDAPAPRESDADEALASLRDRYARGEIDDEEFEARVERLLETESVDDAETFLGGERDVVGDADHGAAPEATDRDRASEEQETERA